MEQVLGEAELSFEHIKFEVSTRYPSVGFLQAVAYIGLEHEKEEIHGTIKSRKDAFYRHDILMY